MARRKNTRRFDPRYFMDEKTDVIEEQGSFTTNMPDNIPSTADVMQKMRDDGTAPERFSPGDSRRQKFEEMAQVLRDDFADIIEKVEVLNIDNEEPAIPYAKVTFLNGAQKNYDDPIKMEQDISDLVHRGDLRDIDI